MKAIFFGLFLLGSVSSRPQGIVSNWNDYSGLLNNGLTNIIMSRRQIIGFGPMPFSTAVCSFPRAIPLKPDVHKYISGNFLQLLERPGAEQKTMHKYISGNFLQLLERPGAKQKTSIGTFPQLPTNSSILPITSTFPGLSIDLGSLTNLIMSKRNKRQSILPIISTFPGISTSHGLLTDFILSKRQTQTIVPCPQNMYLNPTVEVHSGYSNFLGGQYVYCTLKPSK